MDCLLVARDPNLLRVLTTTLNQLVIESSVCPDAEEALDWLHRTKFDSVLVDCVEFDADAVRVLQSVRRAEPNSHAIVLALVDQDPPAPRSELGANFVLERPLQPDLLARSLRAARSLMIQERRRYFRHPVDLSASLIRGHNEVRVTMTNVSSGGLAFRTEKPLNVGWSGQVEFTLPEVRLRMECQGEIVWLNERREGGIRFTAISPKQQQPFADWLATLAGEKEELGVLRVTSR